MIDKNRVSKYCSEDPKLIENYALAIADIETWDCHHRLETECNLTVEQLQEQDRYFNRPASELIFLTKKEHAALHGLLTNKRKGKPVSEAAKTKTRATWKEKYSNGYINPRTGKSPFEYFTDEELDEWRKEASKRQTEYYKQHPEVSKRIGEKNKGKKRSDIQKQHYKEAQNRPEVRKRKSEATKGENNPMYGKCGEDSPIFGRTWINNSIEAKLIPTDQLDLFLNKGYIKGRL